MRRWYQARRAARGMRSRGLAPLVALALLLAACSGGNGGTTASRTPTATSLGAGRGQNPNATPQNINTPGAPEGIAGLCALPASVSAQPPSDIPPYPGAQLHIGSNQNGAGLFGYCTTAAVAAVNTFYTAQIPKNGWQNMSSSTIGGTDQIAAIKGSTTLIVTILTDGQVNGDTDIIIVTGTNTSGG